MGNIQVQSGVQVLKRISKVWMAETTAALSASKQLEMKLLKATTKQAKTPPPDSRMKLNRLVLLVTLLWVVTSLLLLLYHAGTTHGIQHRNTPHQQLALASSQAAARASFIY